MASKTILHLLVIFASVLALSMAMPTRQEELNRLVARLQAENAEENDPSARNLDALGGGNLLRTTRGMDPLSGLTFGYNKRFDTLSGVTFGGQKRTITPVDFYLLPPSTKKEFGGFSEFDEIDKAGFAGFHKRNFDEIDHSNFPSFAKRLTSRVPSKNMVVAY